MTTELFALRRGSVVWCIPSDLNVQAVSTQVGCALACLLRTHRSLLLLCSVLVAVRGEVILHGRVEIFLLAVEDIAGALLEHLPHICIVHLQVGAQLLNLIEQLLNAAVNVANARVSSRPHYVVHLLLIFLNLEVPDSLVGAQRAHEFALLVLRLAILNRVRHRALLVLLCVSLLGRLKHQHMLALSTFEDVFVDSLLDVCVTHFVEAFEEDVVLEVLQHVHIQVTEAEHALGPALLELGGGLVPETFPDPSAL